MTPRINTTDYIRPSTAATLAGVSRALAYRMVKDGTVPSVEIDGTVFVHRSDVAKIVAAPGMGRPKGSSPKKRKRKPRVTPPASTPEEAGG
jgi:hypothetical protein